ncbi:MAG: pyridoxine 5'-phosphate synthase [bacterium]|nr:pyridoxine 5'-phosphate synthase [bacterium]
MAKLSVNIDHIATLRQARLAKEPDPIYAAVLVELAGAHGITVHLREDRRHIQDRDVKLLREILHINLNLEMAATSEMLDIARTIKPDLVTLVPEKRAELTTEGGLDVVRLIQPLRSAITELHQQNIPVSLFIDPIQSQVDAAKSIGADYIELHTGKYCEVFGTDEEHEQYQFIADAAIHARDIGLKVNAGHGLNYQNISRIAAIQEIQEFSIGHSIVARAVLVGLDRAVREMLELLR